MEICVNGVSKIYGKGDGRITALDQADMVIGEKYPSAYHQRSGHPYKGYRNL